MSKHNKANKNNYNQAGRLTPDELARERMKQDELSGRPRTEERLVSRMRDESRDRVSEATRPSGERESSRPRSEREEAE